MPDEIISRLLNLCFGAIDNLRTVTWKNDIDRDSLTDIINNCIVLFNIHWTLKCSMAPYIDNENALRALIKYCSLEIFPKIPSDVSKLQDFVQVMKIIASFSSSRKKELAEEGFVCLLLLRFSISFEVFSSLAATFNEALKLMGQLGNELESELVIFELWDCIFEANKKRCVELISSHRSILSTQIVPSPCSSCHRALRGSILFVSFCFDGFQNCNSDSLIAFSTFILEYCHGEAFSDVRKGDATLRLIDLVNSSRAVLFGSLFQVFQFDYPFLSWSWDPYEVCHLVSNNELYFPQLTNTVVRPFPVGSLLLHIQLLEICRLTRKFISHQKMCQYFEIIYGISDKSWLVSERWMGDVTHQCVLAQQAEIDPCYHSLCPENYLYYGKIDQSLNIVEAIRAHQAILKNVDVDIWVLSWESDLRYRLALFLWLSGGKLRWDKNGCLAFLMAALKLNPENGDVYTLVGHYYSCSTIPDKARSKKCYLKAISLQPWNGDAGYSFIELLMSEENGMIVAKKTLEDLSLSSTSILWSSALQGHLYQSLEQNEKAISCFQQYLKLYENNGNCWHALGMCFISLEQYQPALKCFQEAAKLLPQNCDVLISLGESYRKLCMLEESKSSFLTALALSPSNVEALYGMGNLCLLDSYEAVVRAESMEAVMNVEEGIAYARKAISICQNNGEQQREIEACLLGLLSHLLIFSRHLSPFEIIRHSMLENSPSFDIIAAGHEEIIKRLRECQEINQRLLSESVDGGASSYYNLGCSFYWEARETMSYVCQGSGFHTMSSYLGTESIKECINKAHQCFLHGLQLDPKHSQCWVGLGLTQDSLQEEIACWIRSSQLDNNPNGYGNISAKLLLLNPTSEEAMNCLRTWQMLDANPTGWVTLGSLFERKFVPSALNRHVVDRNLLSSYDAYNAALEVAKPVEALLGSAITWCKIHGFANEYYDAHAHAHNLAPEEQDQWGNNLQYHLHLSYFRHEVENKLLCYCQRKPYSWLAWAMLSWSLECRNNFPKALHCATMALLCLQHEYKYLSREELSEGFVPALRSIIYQLNRCRLKWHVHDSSSAIVFQSNAMERFAILNTAFPKEFTILNLLESKLQSVNKDSHFQDIDIEECLSLCYSPNQINSKCYQCRLLHDFWISQQNPLKALNVVQNQWIQSTSSSIPSCFEVLRVLALVLDLSHRSVAIMEAMVAILKGYYSVVYDFVVALRDTSQVVSDEKPEKIVFDISAFPWIAKSPLLLSKLFECILKVAESYSLDIMSNFPEFDIVIMKIVEVWPTFVKLSLLSCQYLVSRKPTIDYELLKNIALMALENVKISMKHRIADRSLEVDEVINGNSPQYQYHLGYDLLLACEESPLHYAEVVQYLAMINDSSEHSLGNSVSLRMEVLRALNLCPNSSSLWSLLQTVS